MFDLDDALARWRRKLNEAGLKAPVVLEELESHLRDEIEALLKCGLNEQQAFETAVQRIGQAGSLKREFAKVGPKLQKCFTLGTVALYCLVGGGAALLRLGSFADVNSAQQFSALTAVVLAALLVFSGPVFAKVAPVVSDQRLRMIIHGIGFLCVFLWLALFYHHVMTRVEWDMSQLVVAILWAWIPLAALCGMIFGMEEAAAERTPKTHV
jgi:hypothetical protein